MGPALASDGVMRTRWFVLDLLAVLVFVVIGRSVHDHGVNLAGVASTVWPFAVGLSVGWLVVIALGRIGANLRDGVVIAVITVLIGMLLRAVVGQGVAFAFVLVALGFLSAFMLGWRAVLGGLRHVRYRHSGRTTSERARRNVGELKRRTH
jgi:Protein of unknown function (DUF3054)